MSAVKMFAVKVPDAGLTTLGFGMTEDDAWSNWFMADAPAEERQKWIDKGYSVVPVLVTEIAAPK